MKKSKLFKMGMVLAALSMASCESVFIFGEERSVSPIETYENCNNCLTFALYNYYGYEGQHFTNKWLGMKEALAEHGINVTGDFQEKDARNFTISYDKTGGKWDLPQDTTIYMTNNQNWDTSVQFTKPLAKYHPMSIISTCNGVEMAASSVLSSGMGVSNATMGGFGPLYRKAFVNGSLRYLVAKYTDHILPIFAAGVHAVDNGGALKNEDGTALSLSIGSWAIQSLQEYDEMSSVDTIDEEHPTLRKINIDKFFNPGSEDYGAAKLAAWAEDSTKENIKALYEENGTNGETDVAQYRTGRKLKCGIIAPSSLNEQVQKYIDYMKGYCGTAYNVEFLNGTVTSSLSQDIVATQLCNQGADFIISVQDDTDRNTAIQICNDKKVYFGIAGSCQNPIDYETVKNLPYYLGSIGTSIEEEKRSAKEMTEYYLQSIIHRAAGDLVEWQCGVKGLDYSEYADLESK